MTIHALILAGGEGSRLGGVRKAELRLGGKTMLERLTERLPDGVRLLMSTGRLGSMSRIEGVPDREGVLAGPLAGLAAAVAHLRDAAPPDDVLVSVAVDTPFLPTDYFSRLALGSPCYAAWRDQVYPTNAAYRLDMIMDLPERAAELGSPRNLLKSLRAEPMAWEDAENPFANLNTINDVITLARRAQ